MSLNPRYHNIDILQNFITGDPQMDMATQMRTVAMISIGDLDILIADREEFENIALQGMLLDISTWIPAGSFDLLITEGMDGRSTAYGVSVLDSRILKEAEFSYFTVISTPYMGVFINANRETYIKQAMALLLEE
jgi:hypothetical protein